MYMCKNCDTILAINNWIVIIDYENCDFNLYILIYVSVKCLSDDFEYD